MSKNRVAILDAGAQYAKIIDRRIRELNVESEILPISIRASELSSFKAIIISGGPSSVLALHAPTVDSDIFKLDIPILGICYGLQLINKMFHGTVEKGDYREDGQNSITLDLTSPLFKSLKEKETVLLTHGDVATVVASGFKSIASCEGRVSAIANDSNTIFGVQFHPEVDLTPCGTQIFKNFLELSNIQPDFVIPNRINTCIELIRKSVPSNKKVLLLLSGGVDSTVCAALLSKALSSEQIIAIHIDNGFMRKNESATVVSALEKLGLKVSLIRASLEFFSGSTTVVATVETCTSGCSVQFSQKSSNEEVGAYQENSSPSPNQLTGKNAGLVTETRRIPIGPLNSHVICPEQKRKIIGDTFMRVAAKKWNELELDQNQLLLCQGTLRPDLIESASSCVSLNADAIKTHHNATDLVIKLKQMGRVLEPLADFHKDEVRQIGRELDLPEEIISRHPFPGPGLAIRVLCATEAYIDKDFLETTSLIKMIAGYEYMSQKPHALLNKINCTLSTSEQTNLMEITAGKVYSAHLLPIRSVGVQGDHRTYSYACAISSNKQPDWKSLFFLARVIPRICHNINRVVYVFGEQVAHPINDVTVTYLRQPVLETLREADAVANAILRESGFMNKISQMPVVLIPIHFDRDPMQCVAVPSILRSIVLRPFITSDFMTGLPAIPGQHLSEEIVLKMKEAVLQVPGISRVLYDLTAKPPGTTEWE